MDDNVEVVRREVLKHDSVLKVFEPVVGPVAERGERNRFDSDWSGGRRSASCRHQDAAACQDGDQGKYQKPTVPHLRPSHCCGSLPVPHRSRFAPHNGSVVLLRAQLNKVQPAVLTARVKPPPPSAVALR